MDRTQLLRLLDEAHAVLQPSQIREMAMSMDLSDRKTKNMLMEASEEWEAIKDARVAGKVKP